jgi:hypothetical protein
MPQASLSDIKARQEASVGAYVNVVLHIRPLLQVPHSVPAVHALGSHLAPPAMQAEVDEGCSGLLQVHPGGSQITVGMALHQSSFAFDRVYGAAEHAEPSTSLYSAHVAPLVDALFQGRSASQQTDVAICKQASCSIHAYTKALVGNSI